MWSCLFSGRRCEATFQYAQWRKIKQMQPMRLCMQLFILAIWGHIWRCTVEKSQNNATNVIWHLIVLAIWPKNNLTKLGRYLHNLHKDSFLLNDPWQNPWMLRFIISMGFAIELWENPLHGKTHIPWLLPWYMGYAIDLWQNPWDTLIRPRHAVICDPNDREI